MTRSSWSAPNPIPDSLRRSLKDLRHGLLGLHKSLIVSEQVTYERIYGRVSSAGQLLQLVMNDPWFAWLHPLSPAPALCPPQLPLPTRSRRMSPAFESGRLLSLFGVHPRT